MAGEAPGSLNSDDLGGDVATRLEEDTKKKPVEVGAKMVPTRGPVQSIRLPRERGRALGARDSRRFRGLAWNRSTNATPPSYATDEGRGSVSGARGIACSCKKARPASSSSATSRASQICAAVRSSGNARSA